MNYFYYQINQKEIIVLLLYLVGIFSFQRNYILTGNYKQANYNAIDRLRSPYREFPKIMISKKT